MAIKRQKKKGLAVFNNSRPGTATLFICLLLQSGLKYIAFDLQVAVENPSCFTSTRFPLNLHRIPNPNPPYPLFPCLLPQRILRTGWRLVTGWQVGATVPGNFIRGFNTVLNQQGDGGTFRAPLPGMYGCAANIVLQGLARSSLYRVIISVNRQFNLRGSHHAMTGASFNEHAFNVGGIFKLNAGESVMVYVLSTSDTDYVVSTESGFHCAFIGRHNEIEAFNANGRTNSNTARVASIQMRNFQTTGAPYAFSTTRNFDGPSNTYSAAKAGIYLLFANLRFNNMDVRVNNPFFRVKIGKMGYSDFHGTPSWIEARPPRNYYSAYVAGSLLLQSGDTLRTETTSRADTSWQLYGVSRAHLKFQQSLRPSLNVPCSEVSWP